jgi:(2R)-3-sulfolactate dehydrogenase (NADP+)
LPTYCAHALSGKVDGLAQPTARGATAATSVVDAHDGFAHPAIDVGFAQLVPAARQQGIGALAITNSYNCGVVGHHVERLAREGLCALAFVNTPAAIAPWGGKHAFFGTNPIACAAPRRSGPPLVIDQSASVIARGEVMLAARQGRSIPEGWALDAAGVATTDPQAALAGSMLPAGGHKGAGMALIVEILAAVLTGASLSCQASSFAGDAGGPPRTGQFFVAIDPRAFVGGAFEERLDSLIESMVGQPGVRLPGAKRMAARQRAAQCGVRVSRSLYDDIARRIAGG